MSLRVRLALSFALLTATMAHMANTKHMPLIYFKF